MEKKHSRKILRSLLSGTTKGDRARWSISICNGLSDWISRLSKVRTIATYAALGNEVDLASLHAGMSDRYEFAYPLVVGRSLQFHLVDDPQQLRKGSFGILEPDPRIHHLVKPVDLDLCLCPGLGFDLNGGRLGRGMAYYDSVLTLLDPKAFRVGIAFNLQLSASLPCENHDVLMTHLGTERGVRPIRATSS